MCFIRTALLRGCESAVCNISTMDLRVMPRNNKECVCLINCSSFPVTAKLSEL